MGFTGGIILLAIALAMIFFGKPLGMFAPTNPDVNCEASDFSLLEKPTKMMPGP